MRIDDPERLLLTQTLTELKPSTVDHGVIHVAYSLGLLETTISPRGIAGSPLASPSRQESWHVRGGVLYSLTSTHLAPPESAF